MSRVLGISPDANTQIAFVQITSDTYPQHRIAHPSGHPVLGLHRGGSHGVGPQPTATPPHARSKASYSRAWKMLLNVEDSPQTGESRDASCHQSQPQGNRRVPTVTRAPRRGGQGRQAAGNTGLTQFAGTADTGPCTPREQIFLVHLASGGARRCASVRLGRLVL